MKSEKATQILLLSKCDNEKQRRPLRQVITIFRRRICSYGKGGKNAVVCRLNEKQRSAKIPLRGWSGHGCRCCLAERNLSKAETMCAGLNFLSLSGNIRMPVRSGLSGCGRFFKFEVHLLYHGLFILLGVLLGRFVCGFLCPLELIFGSYKNSEWISTAE